uniref:BTB domain-containing protein n=1 Tax=Panagrellus redivivus TaxID=6233 RepID=A0A7E4VGP7_PANRE
MSTTDRNDVEQLRKQIGGLYLSNEFSDVKIAIGDVEIPAHRNILSQRCPYFKAMFASGMLESTSKRIELRETPINGFKAVLKSIYTGVVEFSNIDTALETLRLCRVYELTELEKLAVHHVVLNCNIDNICLIFNNIVLPESAHFLIYAFVKQNMRDVLTHETFPKLSKDALNVMLTKYVDDATNVEILEAFVRWIKAHPDQSTHFLELLKLIPLNSIGFGELASIVPSELISANVLIEVAREQQLTYKNGSVVDTNFAVPKYGAKTIIGGKNVFFSNRFFQQTDVNTKEVVIDLGQQLKINMLWAERAIGYSEASRIDVSVSTDGVNWVIVVHQISLNDGYNDYNFEERVVRFIRIRGTVPLKELLHLSSFEALLSS